MANKDLFLVGDKFVELTNWEKFTHYSLPFSLIFAPVVIATFLTNPLNDSFFLGFLSFLVLIGFLTYQLQRKRLKFKMVSTNLSEQKILDIIDEVGMELEWEFLSKNQGLIKAQTRPSFFSGSWGERITILLKGNKVYVNSICDPDRRSSMYAMGRNKKNEQTLLKKIKTHGSINYIA